MNMVMVLQNMVYYKRLDQNQEDAKTIFAYTAVLRNGIHHNTTDFIGIRFYCRVSKYQILHSF